MVSVLPSALADREMKGMAGSARAPAPASLSAVRRVIVFILVSLSDGLWLNCAQSSRLAGPGASAAAQLGKILLPVLLRVPAGRIEVLGAAPLRLELAQLDAADLAGD